MEKQECVDRDQEVMSDNKKDVTTDANAEKSSNEGLDSSITPLEAEPPQQEYVTGARLFLVVASVTLVAFLMMLDMSILATVCFDIEMLKFHE